MFNNVLLSHLKPIIDPQLSQCQSGFRAGRSTTKQLMALRGVIDSYSVMNITALLVSVDFQKAFDTLHRPLIPVILSQYNVPNCLIINIIQMYSDTFACISTELGLTEWFMTISGVLQGDTLSLYVFIALLVYALKKTLQGSQLVCQSAVESILLYGLKYIPLTLILQVKLDAAYRRILSYALRVHFPDCISNAELTRRTGATDLPKTLRQRRLRLVRRPENG